MSLGTHIQHITEGVRDRGDRHRVALRAAQPGHMDSAMLLGRQRDFTASSGRGGAAYFYEQHGWHDDGSDE